ncbi:TlpA family protein disulfide reductase [Sphingobacterium sp. MYb382]|uniref:TlpA family protein disulfide reductase n=1 Tax=Sphingobacterium sp. MYb382 TaxID=2745278 RepID=UPI003095EFA5
MIKDKKKFWKITSNIIFGLIIILLLVPTSRVWIQQGLMKVGLFKPKLEQPAEVPAAAAETTTEDKAPVTAVFSDDEGKPVDILDLKGKVVFLNFWATWCPPCKAEMPSIQNLVKKFKGNDKVVFMLVEIEHEKEKAHTFLKENKLNLPIYYPESEIPSEWLGQSIPTTIILDKDGRIAARHEGMADYDRKEVFEFITDLINK